MANGTSSRPASTPMAGALRTALGVGASGALAATFSDNLVPIAAYFIAPITPDAIEPNVFAMVGATIPVLVTAAGAALLSYLGSASRDSSHEPGPTPVIVQAAAKVL